MKPMIMAAMALGLLSACPSINQPVLPNEGQVTFLTTTDSQKSPRLELRPGKNPFQTLVFQVRQGETVLDEAVVDVKPETFASFGGRRFKFLPQTTLRLFVQLKQGEQTVAEASTSLLVDPTDQVVYMVLDESNALQALEETLNAINQKEKDITALSAQISDVLNQIQVLRSTNQGDTTAQIARLQDQLSRLQTNKAALQADKDILLKQLATLEAQSSSNNTAQLQLKALKLKEQIEDLAAQKKALETQASQLRSSSNPFEQDVYNQLQQELLQLEPQLTQRKLELAQIEQDLSAQGSADQGLSAEARLQLEVQLANLKEEQKELEQSRLALLEKQDSLSQARLLKIEASLADLEQAILNLEKRLET